MNLKVAFDGNKEANTMFNEIRFQTAEFSMLTTAKTEEKIAKLPRFDISFQHQTLSHILSNFTK